MAPGAQHQSRRGLLLLPRVWAGDAQTRQRQYHQYRFNVRDHLEHASTAVRLQRIESWGNYADEITRWGMGETRSPGQQRVSRLYWNRDDENGHGKPGVVPLLVGIHPDGQGRRTARGCKRCRVS